MSELKRIVDAMDETFQEFDRIRDRLASHVVELAMLRRDMEEADAERLGRARADDGAHRTFAGNVVPLVVAVENDPKFETRCHCALRIACTCPHGEVARDCPWRVAHGLAGKEMGA
ncbi:hypothetical protein D5400_11600 [Georhizobium profundi]|uniref:Uncharacterized protein n=1 Tax=Georhizobium profundi TaxID=2341112 RepID=A0A3Q8XR96_9HYPH|nr:hypothetical protein [Georhizobium profundi]AZN71833.1 hypothetical protein D5400_11600 [Georhizobium profundi]